MVYLAGPLTFLSQLRAAFDRILGVKGLCPENSLYYVAAGAALSHTGEEFGLAEITDRIAHYSSSHHYQSSAALFHDEEEYQEFTLRHQKDSVPTDAPLLEDKSAYVGIDAGSTTVKAVAVNPRRRSSSPLPAQLWQPGAPGAGLPPGALQKVPGYPGPLLRLHGLR